MVSHYHAAAGQAGNNTQVDNDPAFRLLSSTDIPVSTDEVRAGDHPWKSWGAAVAYANAIVGIGDPTAGMTVAEIIALFAALVGVRDLQFRRPLGADAGQTVGACEYRLLSPEERILATDEMQFVVAAVPVVDLQTAANGRHLNGWGPVPVSVETSEYTPARALAMLRGAFPETFVRGVMIRRLIASEQKSA